MKTCPECYGNGGGFEANMRGSSWITCRVCHGKGEVTYTVYCQAMVVIQQRERWQRRFVKKIAQEGSSSPIDSVRFADGAHFRIFRLGGG